MNASIWMAVLIDTDQPGGYWSPRAREQGNLSDWSRTAPRHLSFHTSEGGARAALLAAAKQAWDDDDCAYSHGPWSDDDEAMLRYLRHAGYEAHVTEQTVYLDTPEEPVIVSGVTATVVDWRQAANAKLDVITR